jgi:hypothetical protein
MRHVRDIRGAGDLPIRVRLVANMPGRDLADCVRRSDHYLVRVDRRLPDLLRWFVLLHELSHAVAWDESAEIDHNDCGDTGCLHYGCAYARLWREHHHDQDHAL